MGYSKIFMQLEELFNKYNFGKLTEEPKQIIGGLMHRMYQVTLKEKKYAIKEMNPSVMKRTGVVENIINSDRIAEALKGIVPLITAVHFNESPLLTINGKYYMVFEWLDGVSIFPPDITSENCMKIGMLLGKIHSADVVIPDIQKELNDTVLYEWDKYQLLGQEAGAEWIVELSQVIDDLKKWNQKSNEAYISLKRHLVLSHRDLDPKNIMWKGDNPYIIDWESAGYINPHQELLELLNYWTDNGKGEIDKGKFIALYHAYIEVVGSCQVNWDKVIAGGFEGMLGWLNYNLKRSLGIECSSLEEKNLGTEQVFHTIKALKQYSQQTDLMQNWINGGLNKMDNIHFKDIDYTNENVVRNIKLKSEQEKFIENVGECLKEASIYSQWKPVAIYYKEVVVGFAMYGSFGPNKDTWIDRIIIDEKYQGKGFGRIAIMKLIDIVSKKYEVDTIYLSIVKDNILAYNLYKSIGFEYINEKDANGELIFKYRIQTDYLSIKIL